MKGQEWIGGLFSLLLAGVIAGIALPAILPGQALKVTPEMEANEFENKAILLANFLLANHDIVYFDGDTFSRGVFNVVQLDDQLNLFFKKGSLTELYRCIAIDDKCKLATYPGSYALIIISDTNGSGWFTGTNRLSGSEEVTLNIVTCFQNQHEMGIDGAGKIFEPNSDLVSILELEQCNLKRHSNILNKGLPVSIRYSDEEIHQGILKVLVVE